MVASRLRTRAGFVGETKERCVSANRASTVFGKRKEPHTVIIAHGDDIRHFTVRPWLAALVGSAFAAIAIGYLMATAYLVLRDDLIGASIARQARLQQSYEDRIAALRAQVDRITSRQLLDQQLVEQKVAELISRQESLADRTGRLGAVLDRSAAAGLPATAPKPAPKPDQASLDGTFTLAGLEPRGEESEADRADRLFVSINHSLQAIETDQVARLDAMTEHAWTQIEAIDEAVRAAGLTLALDGGSDAVGGPLIAADPSRSFDSEVAELDATLTRLDRARAAAREVPLGNPAPGNQLTSPFGSRTDPILGTPAFHAGLDFRTASGTPVHATAAGTVSKSGWNGGYGQMVEIDHGNGLSTRYAHLSDVTVAVGQAIALGAVIGRSGSTGRSTGPHLHYEVRRNGDAVDPLVFLKAGRRIAGSL